MYIPSYLKVRYRDLIKQLIVAAKRDNRRRNSCKVTFNKEPSKYIRLE